MDIQWDGVSRRDWRRLTADADWCALEQSWAYGDAMAARPGTEVRRAVVKDRDGPAAAIQVFARRLGPFITVMQILRGPIWVRHDLSRDKKLAALQCIAATIKRGPREIIFWTPELFKRDLVDHFCDRRQRNHHVEKSPFGRNLWHAVDDTRFLILTDGHAASSLDLTDGSRPVASHTRHNDGKTVLDKRLAN